MEIHELVVAYYFAHEASLLLAALKSNVDNIPWNEDWTRQVHEFYEQR